MLAAHGPGRGDRRRCRHVAHQGAVRSDARVETRPVRRPELLQPSPDHRSAPCLPAAAGDADDRAEIAGGHGHASPAAHGSRERGASVRAITEPRPEHVGNRGRHVERLYVGVVDPRPSLPRRLDEERHRSELLDIGAAHAAARGHAHLPGEAVVSGHEDQSVVVDPGSLELSQEAAEQPVDEAELEQVALLVVAGQIRVAEAAQAVHVRHEVACAVARAGTRREVQVRPVRKQHVLHPQRGARVRPDPAHEAPEALRASTVQTGNDRRAAR